MKSLLLICVLLTGCAATVKASSPRSVVIHAGGIEKAQALANQECDKHKRYAEFVRRPEEFVYQFRCVE